MHTLGKTTQRLSALTIAILTAVTMTAITAADAQATTNTIDPTNSDPGMALFGWAVDIDGMQAVVGAPGNRRSGNRGAVAILDLRSAGWELTQVIWGDPTGDEFGYSVSMSDGTLMIGAPGDDTMGPDAGAAHRYVLDRATSTWVFEQTFYSPNPASRDRFGHAVLADDLTGDFVGAPGAKMSRGIVFHRHPGHVSLVAIEDPDGHPDQLFGNSLDVDGRTLVVGAPGDRRGMGAVFTVYTNSDAVTRKLIAPLAERRRGANLGYDVSISGSLVAAGAHTQNRVYVFDLARQPEPDQWFSVPAQFATIRFDSPDPVNRGSFGQSVALFEDRLIVGAPAETDSAWTVLSGKAYEFQATTGSLIATIDSPLASHTDRFGAAVATGGATTLIGAPRGQQTPGSGYVWIAS